VTGVEKRDLKTPIEIEKQAVDLDEKVFGVAAPAVGPWQRQLNELGGVRGAREAAGLRPLRGTRARIWAAPGPAGGGGCGRSGQAVPHPQPRSSEGSAAPAAEAAGGDESPTGTW
jgi:hypothetical protein